jgi:hypothetical protein
MDTIVALHTAARRSCMTEHAIWVTRYSDLQSAEGFQVENYFRPGWTYSRDAYDLFPRYRLAESTLLNLEGISFEDGTPVEQVLKLLLEAGQDARDRLLEEFAGKHVACAALTSQSAAYQNFVQNASLCPDQNIEPLPYRRVLTRPESEILWENLRTTLQVRGAGYGWFPLTDDVPPPGTLTFHADLWRARGGHALLQRFLLRNGVQHCFLLRELGPPDFQMEVILIPEAYDGSESFLFSDAKWVLYTSHESSLTLTGTLADFFRREWIDAEEVSYKGAFHTTDLRGSWDQ